MNGGEGEATAVRHWLYDWNGANTAIAAALHTSADGPLTLGAHWLSALGSYWGAPLVALALFACSGPAIRTPGDRTARPVRRFALSVALALAAAFVLKYTLQRPRPEPSLAGPDNPYSFPSGHATYAGVLLASFWGRFRWWPVRIVWVAFALAVGWSRIALGAHFPADVVFGMLLGIVSVPAVARAERSRPRVARSSP